MRVIIDIDERYARVLCLTAINNAAHEVNVTSAGFDLENGQYLRIDRMGMAHQTKEWEGMKNGT